MTADEFRKDDREKLYVSSLLGLAFIVSLVLEWGIVYSTYPFIAVTHWAFYQSVFQHLILLAIIPYFIAWGSGKLLSFISFLMRADKRYKPQYFVAWISIVVFSYYTGLMSVGKHDNLDKVIDACMRSATIGQGSPQAGSNQLQMICANRIIPIYSELSACIRLKDKTKSNTCINTTLKSVGFTVGKPH